MDAARHMESLVLRDLYLLKNTEPPNSWLMTARAMFGSVWRERPMFPSGQVRILRRYDNEGAFMVLFDGWVFRSRRGFERRLTRRGILVGRARSACLSQILCCSWDDIVLQPWIPALHYVQSKSTLIPTLHLIQRLLEFRCESLSIRDDRNKPTCTSRSVVILPGFRLFADAGQRAHLIQMSDFEMGRPDRSQYLFSRQSTCFVRVYETV